MLLEEANEICSPQGDGITNLRREAATRRTEGWKTNLDFQ